MTRILLLTALLLFGCVATYSGGNMTHKSGLPESVSVETPESTAPETASKIVYTWVTVDDLHIRETPQGAILGIVHNGDVLIVIAQPINGWVLVSDGNGLIGYVAVEFTGLGR